MKSLIGILAIAGLVFSGSLRAVAAPTDQSEALGQFLGGVIAGAPLNTVVGVAGSQAENPSGAHPLGANNTLSAEVLNAVAITLPTGLNLLGDQGLLTLGAVSQYSEAQDNGDAIAASGALSDGGTISTGTPDGSGEVKLNANALLDTVPAASGVISDLSVGADAISARAEQIGGADPALSYRVAGLKLNLASPTVGAVGTTLRETVAGPIQTAVDTLVTAVNALNIGAGIATVRLNMSTINIADNLPAGDLQGNTDNGVTINLNTGAVAVDLEKAIKSQDSTFDINNLPPNTNLLDDPYVSLIAKAVTATLTDIVQKTVSDILADVNDLRITGTVSAILVGGADINISLGDLQAGDVPLFTNQTGLIGTVLATLDPILRAALSPIVSTLMTTLDDVQATAVTPLLNTLDPVVSTALGVVNTVLGVIVNGQPTALTPAEDGDLGAGSTTVRALSLSVLADTVRIDLASATVRGAAAEAPSLTATPNPVEQGGTVTLSGTGFVANEPVTITGRDGFTVTTTADATGAFTGVTSVIDAAFPLGALDLTATGDSTRTATASTEVIAPAVVPTITANPTTTPQGTSVEVTGTGFEPNESVTITGPNGISVTTTADATGGFTVPVPFSITHPVGDAELSAIGVVSNQAATTTVTVTAAPAATLTVVPNPVQQGGTITMSGTGFAPNETVTITGRDGISVTVTTDGDGNFTGATAAIGAAFTLGALDLTATGDSGRTATGATEVVAPAVVPTITANPSTTPQGTTVTVTGTGFTPNEAVTITGADGINVSATADVDGNFTAPVAFGITYPEGDVTLTATGAVSAQPATDVVTVTAAPAATLTVTPNPVEQGGTVTLAGDGFAPGETVTFTGRDGFTATTLADATGAFTGVTVPLADTFAVGALDVTATGVSTRTATGSTVVTAKVFTPTIVADPTTVPQGSSTTVTGAGFAPNETVTITSPDGVAVTATADGAGAFTVVVAFDAAFTPGAETLTATGAVSATPATADVTVTQVFTPSITVDPSTVEQGDTIDVVGTGFAPNEEVTITSPDGINTTVTTGTDGTFTATIPLSPTFPVGPETITAVGTDSNTPVTTDITVNAATPVFTPTIVADPTTVEQGGTVSVTGAGFAPNETVTLTSANGVNVTVTTNETGGFVTDVTFPATVPVGTETLSATGDVSVTTATTDVVVTAAVIAAITVAPNPVEQGGTVTVSGTGFAPNEVVTLTGRDGFTGTATADASGAFAGVDVVLAATFPVGALDVTGTGVSTRTATGSTEVTAKVYAPAITADPVIVDQGGIVTVTGTGFAPNETVTVTSPDGINSTVLTNAEGGFTLPINVPADFTPGTELLTALGDVSATPVDTTITVNQVFTPSITVDPSTVEQGDTIDVVGTGFAPNETVTITSPDGIDTTVTTGTDGTFTATIPLSPTFPVGPETITAVGTDSNTPATTDITVNAATPVFTPTIVADPTTVPQGSSTTVTGAGFAPNETVSITSPDGVAVTATADDTGAFTVVVAFDAAFTPGAETLTATGNVSATPATADVTVTQVFTPSITVDPSTVEQGDTIDVVGTGFAPNEEVTITSPDGIDTTVTTDNDGNFTVPVVLPPNFPVGPETITAVGTDSNTPVTTDITVNAATPVFTPTIVADPTTVEQGGTVSVTGAGFAPNETVTLTSANGVNVTVTTDETGGFVTDVTFPATVPVGTETLSATGDVSVTPATTDVAVTAAVIAAITVAPNPVEQGGTVTVSGTGFAPNEVVTLTGRDGFTGTATADASGAFAGVDVVLAATFPVGALDVTGTGVSTRTATGATQVTAKVYAPAITADPVIVDQGGIVTVTGTGFAPNETVTVTSPDGINSTVLTNAEGGFTLPINVPADFTPGTELLTALGDVSATPVDTTITVNQVFTPSITVDPSTVEQGDTIDVVGTGFAPNETVTITSPDGIDTTVTTGTDGTFTATIPLSPTFPVGPETITAVGTDSNTPATTDITVNAATPVFTPTIVADPTTVPQGSSTTVTGAGFAPNETVSITSPDGVAVTATADGSGAFTVVVAFDAAFTPGAETLTATGAVSATPATADVTVTQVFTPSIAVDPTTPDQGDTIDVTGTGFAPNETVTITSPDGIDTTVTTDNDGNFTVPVVLPPNFPVGPETITAVGTVSDTPTTTDIVVNDATTPTFTPTITVDPTTPDQGDTIDVTGTGFAPNEDVTITSPDGIDTTVTTDNDGNFTVPVVLPPNFPVGPETITAVGTVSDTPTTTDIVVNDATTPTFTPTITVDPTTPDQGDTIDVTGTGFAPNEDVTITSPDGIDTTVTTDNDGNFTVPVVLPPNFPVGPETITAVGTVSDTPTTTDITVNDATAPTFTPTISVDPTTPDQGDTIDVTGTGFAPNEDVTITSPDGIDTTVTTDNDGNFTVPVVLPPNFPVGPETITAVGTVSDTPTTTDITVNDATAPTFTPSITADPKVVDQGETVEIQGEGFAPNETVEIKSPGGIDEVATTDAEGNYIATIEIDKSFKLGEEPITAIGSESLVPATTEITVNAPTKTVFTPTVSVDPKTVDQGDTITVIGTGFAPDEEVTIQSPDGIDTTVTTDKDGNFTIPVTLPKDFPVGPETITVSGETSKTPTTTDITVNAPGSKAFAPKIDVNPKVTNPGKSVTVTGTGFAPSESVVVTLDSDGKVGALHSGGMAVGGALATLQAFVTSNALGEITATFDLPASFPLGDVAVTALGEVSNQEATAAFDVVQAAANPTPTNTPTSTPNTVPLNPGAGVPVTTYGAPSQTPTTTVVVPNDLAATGVDVTAWLTLSLVFLLAGAAFWRRSRTQ